MLQSEHLFHIYLENWLLIEAFVNNIQEVVLMGVALLGVVLLLLHFLLLHGGLSRVVVGVDLWDQVRIGRLLGEDTDDLNIQHERQRKSSGSSDFCRIPANFLL